jgi:hypothetical protein
VTYLNRRRLRLFVLACLAVAPATAPAQPGVSAQAQAAALERVIQGEDARNAELIREAMQGGAQRRAGIRALGRLEQPDQIRYVAPALGDGVGIRAEAAWALAQLARTPEAVAQVQALLLERAAIDAEAGLWEVWGELAAALGRLPYSTAEQVARTEAMLAEQLPSPESFADPETPAIAGAGRLARCSHARGIASAGPPPRSGRRPIRARRGSGAWRWRRWSPATRPHNRLSSARWPIAIPKCVASARRRPAPRRRCPIASCCFAER